jgi:exopolysaccharide biosynthesis polyprenyl glycosylphosphotransferase
LLEQMSPWPRLDSVDTLETPTRGAPERESRPADIEFETPTAVDLRLDPVADVAGPPPRWRWERRLVAAVVAADVAAVLLASLAAWVTRNQATGQTLTVADAHVPYALLALVAVPVWLLFLVVGGAYDPSLLGDSADEYSKVASMAAFLLTAVCAVSFLGQISLSRSLIAVFFPVLVLFGVLNRYVVRKTLHRRRSTGQAMRQIVVVGDPTSVAHLDEHLCRMPFAGYRVVAAYIPGGPESSPTMPDADFPVVWGEPDQLVSDLDDMDIDAIAVTGQGLFRSESLRSLAWRLHGTGIQLLMAPDLVDIAGPRIVSRPAGGLPMLLVEEPRTTGPARAVKSLTERLLALVTMLAALPLLVVLALLVKLTSRGPVLFRQVRVGRDGRTFAMLKFRSMVEGADQQRDELLQHNELDGPLFKIKDDPRITRVGRWLRRYSLDELPQMWNVVRGDMSVVGPRPPLPSEVSEYGGDIARRLMVKPGITGLWQVSGRADVSWTEAVRLDLYYVENWSLALDLTIMAKTAKTVLTGSGAY